MITCRTAKQCGQADFGWLQARYTFSFGHYFDPKLLGYASLRVLNQEVLAPGAAFQPRTYPQVDILNLILQGEAEYRDSLGNHVQGKEGDVILFSPQSEVSYSEHNLSSCKPLTRIQLWLNACPEQDSDSSQRLALGNEFYRLLASPDGGQGSLKLRQQMWIHHLNMVAGDEHSIQLHGQRAYLQSIHGTVEVEGSQTTDLQRLTCGDGAFVQEEQQLTIKAQTPLRALLIDLPV
ncbi:pirin family protein [Yersinia nurmii]|uniref:Pirin family protein n=1 Tax=Yersinia nurmii TaxID=685706 RepID=A0AAW7K4V2_9GAMM|nr:pirin family protein [Yersinia nurmii]MDN0086334.1 pirin family protein [Yersinia nurmii]CNE49446.1 pirin-like protein YhaK [Yersinia nurmii]